MANHVSHASLPYPIKNARFTIQVPYISSSGDPTDPTTPDTEVSGDAGAFADCAEEVTTISGSNGVGYITLTGAETNYSMVAGAAKIASGPKPTLFTLNPRNLATIGSGTLSAGSAGGGTLGTVLAYDVTGCFIRTTGGTGGGGTGGANNQARRIATYATSTGAFTVTPNWETTPDSTTTYDVLLPEGVTLGMLKALNPATPGRTLVVDGSGLADATTVKVGPTGAATAQTARDIGASVLLSPGTGTGQIALSSGAVTTGTNNDKSGYSLSAVGVQAIWDAATSGLATVGSIGKWILDKLDAAVSSRLASASYATPPTSAENAAGLLAATAYGTVTVAQHLKRTGATTAGLSSGGGTDTEVFYAIGDATASTPIVTFTVDASGNRTAVTYGT